MAIQTTNRLLERLLPPLAALRDEALATEQTFAADIAEVEPVYRASACNLLHYLSVRQHDIRTLQRDLASLGLSSLGNIEANALASLNAALGLLERVTGREPTPAPPAPVDFRTGPLLLRDHTRMLLGPEHRNRSVRIMVTMPSEAATQPSLVQALLEAGMDVMRINCAHDDPAAWAAMAEHLRRAERRVGRRCKVQADLGGPKLRTGRIEPAGRLVRLRPRRDLLGRATAPGLVWLTPASNPEPAPEHAATVPFEDAALGLTRSGDVLRLADARGKHRELRVLAEQGTSRLAEAPQTTYLLQGTEIVVHRDGEPVARGWAGPLPEVVPPITLYPGDTLLLTRSEALGQDAQRDEAGKVVGPARVHCTLRAAFAQVRPGESVWLDDGKIGGIVQGNDGETITVEISHALRSGAKLRAEKGINFPDTRFELPALTDKDLDDLSRVVNYVDMVALSFLRTPDDVLLLEDNLHRLGAGHLGIVLKIENRQAFENLPRILLASLRSPPVGVMVARGDLAVEVGFERLSEVQEEILWLCEAAHIPVIWATQVLENLAKKGAPSRAEITDAAASSRAECVMLNKGPNIVHTVSLLSGILSRMDTHLDKRRATLRKLGIAHFS